MKNLILNHDACGVIDEILIERGALKAGDYFADDTISYVENFLKDSCHFEEVVVDDEIYFEREMIDTIFSYMSDVELKRIVEDWK
jgi:hypothetical protein